MNAHETTIRVLRIETHDSGLFSFAAEGELAAVARVHDSDHDLADFVAWFVGSPGQWWLRHGDCAVLGAHELAVAAWGGGVIRLHATPEDWFHGGRHGVCVLLWGAPLDDLFAGVGSIRCDSPALRQRLITALRRWEPRVELIQQETHHAA